MSDFIETSRPTAGKVWLHVTKPMWVVFYPLPNGTAAEFYQAYRVKDYELPAPPGRAPWTLDNRRLSERGFPTLEAAMQAIRDAQ